MVIRFFIATLICCSLANAQPTDVPFEIVPFAKQESVVAHLKAKNISADYSDGDEFVGPSISALNIRWRDADYDTLRVLLMSETMEAGSVVLIKRCKESTWMESLANVVDVVTELYGEPAEKSDAFAQWTRKGVPAVTVILAEDETSISVQFDFLGIINRLSSTDPDWPYQLPIDATSDEIGRQIMKTCGRITERDESTIGTVACQLFGIKTRRMYIRIDGQGYPSAIEGLFDSGVKSDLLNVLEKRYGPPTNSDDSTAIWRWVGGSDAIKLSETADALNLTFDLLALEKKQYMR